MVGFGVGDLNVEKSSFMENSEAKSSQSPVGRGPTA